MEIMSNNNLAGMSTIIDPVSFRNIGQDESLDRLNNDLPSLPTQAQYQEELVSHTSPDLDAKNSADFIAGAGV